MMIRKRIVFLMVLVSSVMSVTACSNQVNSEAETPYYSMTIDGFREYRTEDDEEVKKLIELTNEYVDLTCNINYQSTDNAMDELDYYNEAYRKEYEEYEYIESGIETIKYYEQVQEVYEKNITEIQFFELDDVQQAWVSCEYIAAITHATDEYFEYMELKKDTKYIRTIYLPFELENGEWKIGIYDITDRVEVQ